LLNLEYSFGKWRHHQRRCSGQKVASPNAVTRGAVQLIAALATQQRTYLAIELAQVPLTRWNQLHAELQQHQHKRTQQRQFRRSPQAFLNRLEGKALQLTLLPQKNVQLIVTLILINMQL
jgi:hypothetical protein